jgi:acyl-CoA thioester hydrolase
MKAEARGPTSGWLDGNTHVLPIRVYYEDTDFSGVVYHANYLRFMERGRSEFLRAIGVRHQGMLKTAEPLVWVVRHMDIEYVKPARVDDELEVRSSLREMTGARSRIEQQIRNAMVEVCVVTPDGRPRRIPDPVRLQLTRFLEK